MAYDPKQTAAYVDDYCEREWRRFEDGTNTPASLDVHLHYLRRFIPAGESSRSS